MIKPILHRILVKPDNVEDVDDVVRSARQSGLVVQLDKREQAAIELGTVVLVGSTCYKEFGTTAEEQGVVVGARVFFAKYAGKSVKDGEIKYLMINDEDCIGIVSDD
jgi:co-chaperonin GroES (HSP10)